MWSRCSFPFSFYVCVSFLPFDGPLPRWLLPHCHFLGFQGTHVVAILYGTQFSIKLGIFPRYFSKGMSSQQALMVPGCRLLQPSNNIDLLMLSRHEAKIKIYIYIKKTTSYRKLSGLYRQHKDTSLIKLLLMLSRSIFNDNKWTLQELNLDSYCLSISSKIPYTTWSHFVSK